MGRTRSLRIPLSGAPLWTSAFLDPISRHNASSQRCRSRQVPSCDAVSRLKGRCFMNADESRQHMRAHLLASADVKLRMADDSLNDVFAGVMAIVAAFQTGAN